MRKVYTNCVKLFSISFLLLFVLIANAQTPQYYNYNTGGTGNGNPFNTNVSRATEWIVAPNEMAGALSGTITKIYFRTALATTPTFTNLKIRLGQTSSTALSSAAWPTNMTDVYFSSSATFTTTVNGWFGFTLTTPFVYDATQSLIVEVSHTNLTGAGPSPLCTSVTPATKRLYGTSTSVAPTGVDGIMAHIGIDVLTSPCVTPPTPGTVVSSSNPSCIGSSFNLTVSGGTIGLGQTYQWQKSSDSTNWNDISGATTSSLTTTQSVTTYYRIAVTCSGNTANSAGLKVTTPAAIPGGTFTIDNSLPVSSGTNFNSFADAINYIKCGISGPVVFNVANGTGAYTEQLVIPYIGGSSSTNTITIKGNGIPLMINSASSQQPGIILNGAKFVTIDSFYIDGSASTYAWGIVLTNQADSNVIKNCTINLSTSLTTTNHIGIILNGSTTSTATSGNNANGNQIINNTINGGYYGIYLYGSTTTYNKRNVVKNNIVKEFYSYGIYISGQDSVTISKNEILRQTRTAVTTTYCIYVSSGTNILVEKNRIHNLFDAAQTNASSCYPIYIIISGLSAAQPNRYENNLIYNINNGGGLIYGIYGAGYNYNNFYHNTVSLDHAGATAGTTYGMYVYGTGVNVKNNIVYISRGGTGSKYCLYYSSTGVSSSNNNVLWMASTGGTTNSIGYYNSGYATFSAWQAANSGVNDQQSVNIDPLFTDPNAAPADYTPMESSVNNVGAAVGVTTDLLDKTRSVSNPDPGAYEFSLLTAGTNFGAEGLITPAVQSKGCYTSAETITIKIRNNSLSTHDFVAKPVTITVNISGASSQQLVKTINTGTLASDGTMNVVMTGTVDMSGPGIYTIDAYTSVTGDVNPVNDAMQTTTRTTQTLTVGTAISSFSSICASSGINPTLSTTGANGYSALQWQQSTTPGSGYTNIAGGTVTPFSIPGTITQNMFYRLLATCGTNNDMSTDIQVDYINPQITGTTPATRCGTGTVNLGATAAGGMDVNWYAAASGGTSLGTGTTFTTPVINATTTFYAAAGTSGSTQTSTNGVPTVTTSTQNGGLQFTLNQDVVLNSIQVFSTAAGTATVTLQNSLGTVMYTSAAFPIVASTLSVPQTLTLGWQIPAGTGYRIMVANTGNSLGYSSGSFPAQLGNGVGTITSGWLNTTTSTLNYFVYNMNTTTGCQGSRTAVTATVNPAAALTITSGKTICNNAVYPLQVTSTISDFDSYIWSPATGLYTDAAATIPYSGTSATQVYVKNSTPGATTYTLTATNNASQCANIVTSAVTVLPDPTINASGTICLSGSVGLSLSPTSGYGAGTLQWQTSPNGTTYSDISGATSSTYTTPTLTSTTYYKLILKDQAGATCSQPAYTVVVNNPQVTGTTPAGRCGTGTVTLGATPSSGASLNWYAAASGGTLLASGNTFTTPSISATTTYYVEPVVPNAGTRTVGPVNPSAVGTISASNYPITTYYQQFNVTSAVVLQSVDVFPTAAVGTATSIEVRNSSGTVLINVPYTVTVNDGVTPTTITLNILLAPGTGYRIGQGGTGINLNRNTSGAVYPYTVGPISVTGNNFDPTYWYYIYNWKFSDDCIGSSRTAVTATINPTASNAAGVLGGASECATATINGSTEFNYTDCDRIVILSPVGVSPLAGSVNACVKIDASVQTAPTGEPYVQRHFNITPVTNPATATSSVTLYFLQSEFTAFNVAKGSYAALPTGPSDAAGIANLRITQYNGTGTAPGNYSGPVSYIDPADANIVWNAALSRWEITFNATGSGGFYVHTGKFVLPVTLLEFKGEVAGDINRLSWSTSTETNNRGFELERSADGKNFSTLGFVSSKANGGNSTVTLSYSFNDVSPLAGTGYYRLKQIDRDGRYSYSGVVALTRKVTEIMLTSVYPNPATRELNLVITSPRSEKLTIVVTDLSGKIVMQNAASVVMGDNVQQLNIAQLAGGTYVIKAVCANGCETAVHRFVKQ